ncbi:MAG: hypothetical protein ABFD89_01195 [Bryobacteraceae bacterium]
MTISRAQLVIASSLLLLAPGCGRYADFSLPVLSGPKTASSFRWEALPNPVLARGAAGEWDSVDVLNPSVISHDGKYINLYSGFDGRSWHTGLAVSGDGISWIREGIVLSPDSSTWEGNYIAANGTLLRSGGEFFYWYQAGSPPGIGLARSLDGRSWKKTGPPVLRPGPRGSWDERGVADPYIVRFGDFFYMYFLGQDRARRQRLGVARSPDGVEWEKLRANPILALGPIGSFDEKGLGEPAVWASHGSYWLLYTGRDRNENRRLGLARSSDGVHWTRVPGFPAVAGSAEWDSKVVCDPTVEVTADGIRVWFGGGNVASPDENLNGQIGLAVLRPVGDTLSE